MSVLKIAASALIVTSLITGMPSVVHSFPRLPKIPKLPKKLPNTQKPQKNVPSGPSATSKRRNPKLEYEYRMEANMLKRDIDTGWSSKADNDRIDTAAAEYRSRVDQFASGNFAGVLQRSRDYVRRGLSEHYDFVARTADRTIKYALDRIADIGIADSAYNELVALEAQLYGAVKIFPDNAQFAAAKAKVDTELKKFGSRAGAEGQKDAIVMAKARAVRMPPPTERNKSVENMFRQAWATGGMPYTIKKIHIRGDWSVKRNAYGRVIGRTRDAAIAAKDPNSDRCNLYAFTMLVRTGGSAGRSSHSTKRIACENIPK